MGVEFANEEPSLVAHAVGNLRGLTQHVGIAVCGLPAEYLTLVPDLPWTDVHVCLRCDHCTEIGDGWSSAAPRSNG